MSQTLDKLDSIILAKGRTDLIFITEKMFIGNLGL